VYCSSGLFNQSTTSEAVFSASCRSPHSQTIATLQPAASKSCWFRVSRCTFPANFFCQNSGLVDGVLARRHPSCRCQKHPFTKIAEFHFVRTRSGFPGRSFRCRRNLKPARKSIFLSKTSGFVFFPRIPLIIRERV
jgi:hypothetical protein